MNEFYSEQQRALQDRFETRAIADSQVGTIVHDEVQEPERLSSRAGTCFFCRPSTQWASPPALTKAVIPDSSGSWMRKRSRSRATTATACFTRWATAVGMLFLDFEKPNRLRLHGTASVGEDDPLIKDYPGAEMIVRVAIRNLFINCPRYVHRYQKVSASRYVPRAGCATPFAEWKRIDVLQDALPPRDRGKADRAGGVITIEEYVAEVAAGEG